MVRILSFLFAVISLNVYAGPTHFGYQGRLFDAAGEALDSGSAAITLQLLNPAMDCLLYEEDHTLQMSNTGGFFKLNIGLGTQNTANAPNLSLSDALSNMQSISVAEMGCGGYTPGSGDHRMLRVFVNGEALTPDQVISAVPYSINSNNSLNLAGKSLSTIETEYRSHADQNLAGTVLPNLQATPLVAGDSFRWDGAKWEVFQAAPADLPANSVSLDDLDFASSSGINIPQLGGDPGSPTAGQTYYNTTTNKLMVYNGSAWAEAGGSASLWNTSGSDVSYSAGNVGVGTASPSTNYKVHIANTGTGVLLGQSQNSTVSAPQLDLSDSGRSVETIITSSDGSTNGSYIASYSNSPLMFGTNAGSSPGAKMIIDASGNVGIGITTPNSSAALDVSSTTKGFLPPRMTATQRDSIAAPAEGLVIFNSESNRMNYYDGTNWLELSASTDVYVRAQITSSVSVPIPSNLTVDWNNEISDAGGNLNGTTFTAPSNGYYLIQTTLAFHVDDGASAEHHLKVNGSTIARGNATGSRTASGILDTTDASTVIFLSNGDVVTVEAGTAHTDTTIDTSSQIAIYRLAAGSLSGSADNMGNHVATQNIVLSSNYLSGDGDNEGLQIDTSGNVSLSQNLTLTGTVDMSAATIADNSISVEDLNFASGDGINIPQLASNPGSPTTGQLYYNTTTNKMMVYQGSSWAEVGSSAGGGNSISAWVAFDPSDGSIIRSSGVSGVSRTAAGKYTITFSSAMSGTDYALISSIQELSAAHYPRNIIIETGAGSKTTTSVKVALKQTGSANYNDEAAEAYVAIIDGASGSIGGTTIQMVDPAVGSLFGDFTLSAGLGAIFDGDSSETRATAGETTSGSTEAYVGKIWNSSKTIVQYNIYDTTNEYTFSTSANTSNVTVILQGSNDTTNGTDGTWTDLHTDTFPGGVLNSLNSKTYTSGITQTPYMAHRVKLAKSPATAFLLGEVQFVESVSSGGKFVDGDSNQDAVYTAGNVGVGTTSPNRKLSVAGGIETTNGVYIGSQAIRPDHSLALSNHLLTHAYANALCPSGRLIYASKEMAGATGDAICAADNASDTAHTNCTAVKYMYLTTDGSTGTHAPSDKNCSDNVSIPWPWGHYPGGSNSRPNEWIINSYAVCCST